VQVAKYLGFAQGARDLWGKGFVAAILDWKTGDLWNFSRKSQITDFLCATGNIARPLLGLPIEGGDGIGFEVQGFAEVADGLPLTAFVRQHQLIDGT
jgi:hypothetical protein